MEDLRAEYRTSGTRLRRRELNAIVERASHRLALASNSQLEAALIVSAEELAAGLGADTLGFWQLNSADVLAETPWLWPEIAARIGPDLAGIRVDLIGERARKSPNGIVLLRASELTEDSPKYIRWLRERGGTLASEQAGKADLTAG